MSDETKQSISAEAGEASEETRRKSGGRPDGDAVSHLLLKTLFEGIEEEIMVVDADFIIRDVNPGFLRRLRLSKSKVIGRGCSEVGGGWCREKTCGTELCHLERARLLGQRVESVQRVPGARGQRMREIVRIVYPVGGVKKSPRYLVQITRDETARRQLIRRIKASEKKFRGILDTAIDAILSFNEGHRIVHFNDAARRMFGYSRKEVLGRDFSLLIPPQEGEDYREFRRFLDAGKPRRSRRMLCLSAFRKGGEPFPVEMGVSYQLIDGEPTYTAILRDISEKLLMEKRLLQNERLAAVGRTVAQVAHEIKNPLMIIGGFSRQIRKAVSDETALRKLALISDEVSRLERLVADLGDFTKQYHLVKHPCDINALLRDVAGAMEGLYPPEAYRFRLEFAQERLVVPCDADKMRQVFMNVVGNGLEAMEEGGTMTISSRREGDGVRIDFSDEGRGISERELLKIFEPFFTTRKKGSGLGLSISFKLVEAHGGEISATGKPGQGMTFSIFLPNQ